LIIERAKCFQALEALTEAHFGGFEAAATTAGWATAQNQLGAGHWKAEWRAYGAGLKED